MLAGDDVAFTARGRAAVIEEPMDVAPEYAAVLHRRSTRSTTTGRRAFVVDSGVGRRWIDAAEQQALGARVAALGARSVA